MLLVANLCKVFVEQRGYLFSFKGESIHPDKIFDEAGLLAAIAKRADNNATVCLGYGVGAHYNISDEALLGVKVDFDTDTPTSLRFAFMLDAIEELSKLAADANGVIALDELLYD